MKYSMLFALSPDLENVLLLRKPPTHPNPLFRDRWTAPGGHVEDGESELAGALREMKEEGIIYMSTLLPKEETDLLVMPYEARFVLRFACNCDPLESEHDVSVYGCTLPLEQLREARGDSSEPVAVWPKLPGDVLWYVEPLLKLVKARLKQPL